MTIFGRLFGWGKSDPAVAFREEVRAAFRFLVDEFSFVEQAAAPQAYELAFSTDRTRVVVEGTEYGRSARTAFGGARRPFEDYDLGLLLKLRRPDLLAAGQAALGDLQATQSDAIHRHASDLREVASDVLRGDHTIFPDLAAEIERRRAAYEEHMRRSPNEPPPRF
jgi:hypothetical protein